MITVQSTGRPLEDVVIGSSRETARDFFSLTAALAALAISLVAATPARATDVFLIASYHETDACGLPQYKAAMDALKQGGFANLSAKGYFLDTRVSAKEEVLKVVEQIKKDIRTAKPKFRSPDLRDSNVTLVQRNVGSAHGHHGGG